MVQQVGAADARGVSGARDSALPARADPLTMARLSYPDRATLPASLGQMLGEMPRHAPIEMLAHSPALAEGFLRLAQAQFTGLELPLRDRELLILTVAAGVEC